MRLITLAEIKESKGVGFCVRISAAAAISYLCGALIALFVDPKLTGHVQYPSRHYPDYAYWLVPVFGLLIFASTLMCLCAVKENRRVRYATVPMWIFSLPTFWMLRPEVPHMGLFSSLLFFTILATIAILIRYWEIDEKYLADPELPLTAKMERAKQEIDFWNKGLLGVLASFLALLVSWAKTVQELNGSVTKIPGEQFILNSAAMISVGVVSAWYLGGVVGEVFRKTREALRLLEKVRDNGPRERKG